VSQDREIMTWESFGVASRELAIQIAESGYEPDIILAIARGGLMSAGALGYALSVKNTYTMNVEFYTGVNERLAVPMILPPVPSLVDLKDSKVLIVDDVADTGHTLNHVLGVLQGPAGRLTFGGVVREVAVHRQVRLRVALHRQVDQLPLE